MVKTLVYYFLEFLSENEINLPWQPSKWSFELKHESFNTVEQLHFCSPRSSAHQLFKMCKHILNSRLLDLQLDSIQKFNQTSLNHNDGNTKSIVFIKNKNTWADLTCPFPGDEQEQDVVLDMLEKMFSSMPTTGAVLKLFAAEKDLQVKLAVRVAYLEQSEYTIIVFNSTRNN